MKNLGKDLEDGEVWTLVMHKINPDHCSMDPMSEEDPLKRNQMILDNGEKMGVPRIMRPQDMKKCNTKLNTIFASYIFNNKHGLEPLT